MNLAVAVPEAAAMIGISESMLWRLLAGGDITKVKIGRRTLIRVEELERFLDDHTVDETPGLTGAPPQPPADFRRHGVAPMADGANQTTRGTA